MWHCYKTITNIKILKLVYFQKYKNKKNINFTNEFVIIQRGDYFAFKLSKH